MSPIRLYLSGGSKTSKLRDFVAEQLTGLEHRYCWSLDTTQCEGRDLYSMLDALGRTDCVFAYLDADDPYAWDVVYEVGCAIAQGASVILVCSCCDERASVYPRYCEEQFKTLEEGVAFLKKVITYNC